MIHFAPTYSTLQTVIRGFGRSLLVLPLCVAIIGCDSASSNDEKSLSSSIAPSNPSADSDMQNLAQNLQDGSRQTDNSEPDKVVEGQSLIAAAHSSNDAHTNQSLMSSEPSNRSNTLQATLIGDYGGMVPCESCGSIDVTLNLFADGSVVKTSIYNNPESPRMPLVESGVYRQDNDTITIAYEEKIETYHIQDNHLILLDKEKDLDTDYTLSRQ